jgi:hypothetical protein
MLVADAQQHHAAEARVVGSRGEELALFLEFALEGAVALLVDDHLFNRTPIADQRERIHRNRILQSHKRTPSAGFPTFSRP